MPAVARHPHDGTVVVGELPGHRFAQQIRAGGHILVADEPDGIGDDSGPAPYDLLLAALGTGTSMTIRMYADRHRYPLEHVTVRLRHRRLITADCPDGVGSPCRTEDVEREVRLVGPLGADQRARLLEIAERCPVHRTLTGQLTITTTLATDPGPWRGPPERSRAHRAARPRERHCGDHSAGLTLAQFRQILSIRDLGQAQNTCVACSRLD